MDKVIQPGMTKEGRVFCRIEFKDGNLSLTGVIGPKANGNSTGSCGQIQDSLDELRIYYPGWSPGLTAQLKAVWDRWHLNDMKPGCPHQYAEGWGELRIDANKPLNSYGLHHPGQTSPSWNMLGWVSHREYPLGLLGKPCTTCGYRYGTAWLKEEVPSEVLAFLKSLPNAQEAPAWI